MKRTVSAALLLILILAGCARSVRPAVSYTFFAMDTAVSLEIYGDKETAQQAAKAAEDEFNRLHRLFTRFDPHGSAAKDGLYAINSGAGTAVKTDPELFDLLEVCLDWCARSGGAFDITLGAASDLWGFSSGGRVPDSAELEKALSASGYEKVILDREGMTVLIPEGTELDIGAVAKGYAADAVAKLWREMGIESALLNAGGNVYALGIRPGGGAWKIGLRHPRESGELWTVLEVENTSVVTSGDYQRYFEQDGVRYHHILDPETGRPAKNISVTAVCESSAVADILSTAAFVMERDAAVRLAAEAGAELYFYGD